MKIINILVSITVLSFIFGGVALADKDKRIDLPPGLQKKSERGKELPPGWQKKISVGSIVDKQVYDQGKIISRNGGFITINVEGEIFKVIENTREIVEIIHNVM